MIEVKGILRLFPSEYRHSRYAQASLDMLTVGFAGNIYIQVLMYKYSSIYYKNIS